MTIHPCNSKLIEEIQSCRSCPLNQLPYEPGLPTIGIGSLFCKLMLLGRDPGEQESKVGRPFVGRSGKILQNILQELNITLDDIYVTNIVKHRPPNNIEPNADIINQCKPFLIREIEEVKPKAIICLGKTAAYALNSSKEWRRGDSFLYQGIPVTVTWHPAYVARNPKARDQLKQDLENIWKTL